MQISEKQAAVALDFYGLSQSQIPFSLSISMLFAQLPPLTFWFGHEAYVLRLHSDRYLTQGDLFIALGLVVICQ